MRSSIIAAVAAALAASAPANAGGVSNGAAVGIGLGAFALGVATARPAQPYYPPPAYYPPPPMYVQGAPSWGYPAPAYGGGGGCPPGDMLPSGFCIHGIGAADVWMHGLTRGQRPAGYGYGTSNVTYGTPTTYGGQTTQLGCWLDIDDHQGHATRKWANKGDPYCP